MGDPDWDRPYGDDGFADPKKRGWLPTVLIAVWRGTVSALAGSQGRTWPRQLPLDNPNDPRDYRP
ncbi:hypothetical protein [Curtobacterium sp. 1544]|uniref:hypothetical protein n=1 Tax=Curtobacterium sp. 1544 TaxID=3156417 RepID=UPI00339630A1